MKIKNIGQLFYHVFFIYLIYICNSLLQEKIATHKYKSGDKFDFPHLAFFLQAIFIVGSTKRQFMVGYFSLFVKLLFLGTLNALNSLIMFSSYKFMTFTTMQVLKSSKLLPIILCKYLFFKSTPNRKTLASCLMTTLGVFLFVTNDTNFVIDNRSLPYIGFSLILDGLINSLQDHIFANYTVDSSVISFYTNFPKLIIGSYKTFLQKNKISNFIKQDPLILFHLLITTILTMLGQKIVVSTIKTHGSVVFNYISVTRKIFTVLISSFIYNYRLKSQQYAGLLFVLMGILILGFEKTEKKKKE
ncbi:hypothetical protein NUSPORA_00238 [Nucleospora cyclopteri]